MIRRVPVLAALLATAGCTGDADPALEASAPEPKASSATYDAGKGSYHAGDEAGDALPGEILERVETETPEANRDETSGDAPVVSAPEAAPRVSTPSEDDIVDRDDHVDFALDFLGRQAYNSVAGLMDLYDERVRYFEQGVVPQDAVAEDKATYFDRWPNRYYEIAGPVRATRGETPTIRFDYTYAVSHADGSGEREGRAWTELGLSPDGESFLITSESGGTY